MLSALQQLGRVTPTRSTLPILSSVLVSTEEEKILLRATDLEISQSISIPAKIAAEGSVAVSHRTLQEIIAEMPEGELQIEVLDDRRVQLTTSFGNYSIMGKPTEEFPALPEISNIQSVEFESDLLKKVIEKTAFAVSRDDLKPSLVGVLFRFETDNLKVVATDGHRLVRYTKSNYSVDSYQGDHILPVKFLSILSGYLEEGEKVSLKIGANHIMIQNGNTTLYSRLIEERFPDYESVFPSDNDKWFKTNRNELLSTVKRVSIFSNKTTHQIAFRLDADELEVSTEDVETVSSAREGLPCEYQGDPLVIGYNSYYLFDILSHLDGEIVKGEFKSPVSAAIFYDDEAADDEELMMLLMPIRLND